MHFHQANDPRIRFTIILSAIVQQFVDNRVVLLEHAFVQLQGPDTIGLDANATFTAPLPVRLGDLPLRLNGLHEMSSQPSFIKFNVPGFHVSPSTRAQVVGSQLNISNEADLVDWALRFVRNETVPISVQSDDRLSVFLSSLKYSPRLNTTIEVKGLSTLDEITIPTLKLMLPAVDGNNINGAISLNNTSSLSVNVGDIMLNLLVSEVKVGVIYLRDVKLVPGVNTLPITGALDISIVLANIGNILGRQTDLLSAGRIVVNLTGNTTTVNGQHVRFVDTLLRARPLSVKVTLETLINTVLATAMDIGSGGDVGTVQITASSLLGAVSDTVSNTTLIHQMLGNWKK